MKKTLKDRVLHGLKCVTRKCRILTRPAMFVMVLFLSVYHTVRAVLAGLGSRQARRLVCGGAVVSVLVLALIVWPSMADEIAEGDGIEIVDSFETATPEPTPIETVEPIATEELMPSESPTETLEPVETPAPEASGEEDPADSAETAAPVDTDVPMEGEEAAQDEEDGATDEAEPTGEEPGTESETDRAVRSGREKRINLPQPREAITVSEPKITTQPKGFSGDYLALLEEDRTLKVEVDSSSVVADVETVSFQWYEDDQPIEGADGMTYTIPERHNAGTYHFYCRVTNTAREDHDIHKSKDSEKAEVKINRIQPKIDDVTYKIPKELWYTAAEHVIPVEAKDEIEGLGQVAIQATRAGLSSDLKSVGTYNLELSFKGGINYEAAKIPLEETVTIKRLETPANAYTIRGTKGNEKDGTQWYTTDVMIYPRTGYQIGTKEDGDFLDVLTYSENQEDPLYPEAVYLKQKSTGAVTEKITIDKFRVDTTPPTGEFHINGKKLEPAEGDGAIYCNNTAGITIEPTGDGLCSKEDVECSWYVSPRLLSNPNTASRWTSGKEVAVEESRERFYLYARLVDQAGNKGYISTAEIIIDKKEPQIFCEGKKLKDNRTYIADEKTFTAEDENLKSVTHQRTGDEQIVTVEGNSFTLVSPAQEGGSAEYTIIAVDKAGNETKVEHVTLTDPVDDVTVSSMDFGTLTYGDATDGLAKELTLTKGADYNIEEDPVIESVNALPDEKGGEYFDLAGDSASGYTICPKPGLHAGEYENTFRIHYSGTETESSIKFTAHVTIEKADLTVTYTGHTAYYHTIPDFTPYLEVTGFANGDTAESVREAEKEAFDSAVGVEYNGDDGLPKRAMVTDPLVMPKTGGETRDYVISTANSGTLTVERRTAERGKQYTLDGLEGRDGWFNSEVSVSPVRESTDEAPEGYVISSTTEDEDAFGDEPYQPEDWKEETAVEQSAKFYLMNKATGEIFDQSTETLKIDKTPPILQGEQGIHAADQWWREFIKAVTFNKFFNNTMKVDISATDNLSGIDKETGYQYYVANEPVELDWLQGEDVPWQTGDSFLLEPDDWGKKIVYAKITDRSGLSLYLSTDGLLMDNKPPVIDVKDGEEYITEVKEILVSDSNLIETTLYEGTDTTQEGKSYPVENGESHITIECPEEGSKTYTIVAKDSSNNMSEKAFTITKPIYNIKAEKIYLSEETYGYTGSPSARLTWKNKADANADATVSDVALSDANNFAVTKEGDGYIISAKPGLPAGNYSTQVTLTYNGAKVAETTAAFSVKKAVLNARYIGENVYYNVTPDLQNTIQVTGFVGSENASTASGYVAPVIAFKGAAKETRSLEPSGGAADNYKFVYQKGVLAVTRREAREGLSGQYDITGDMTDTGWYSSQIRLAPKEGFVFSMDEDGVDLKDEFVLDQDTDAGLLRFYVMNRTTHEIYKQSVLEYKMDRVVPALQGITDGGEYTANTMDVVVQDDYLSNVTVNGVSQPVTGSQSVVTLRADQERTAFVIVATDYAGNAASASITLNQPEKLPVADDEWEGFEDEEPAKPTATPKPGTSTQVSSGSTTSENDDGTVKKKVKIKKGAPETAITTKTSQIAQSVLSAGEQKAVSQGSNANVEIQVSSIDSAVSQADKELIISHLNGYTVGEYLDLTLWKTVGSSDPKQVHKISDPLAVTITIPGSLRRNSASSERRYAIIRIHNGAAVLLKDQDFAANTITFYTDRFSTYALVYKDVQSEVTEGSGGSVGVKRADTSTGSGGSAGKVTVSKKSSAPDSSYVIEDDSVSLQAKDIEDSRHELTPEMGDDTPVDLLFMLMAAALAVMLAAGALRFRTGRIKKQ